jgi:hypothetical protein
MMCPLSAVWGKGFLWRHMKHYSGAAVGRVLADMDER